MTIVEALSTVCGPEWHTNIAKPFEVLLDGDRWLAGTDGVRLLMARTDEPAPLPIDGVRPPDVASVCKVPERGARVTRQALLDWIAQAPPRGQTKCAACKGMGKTRHECDCDYCYAPSEEECEDCDGSGMLDGPPSEGQIGAIVVDLDKLHGLLSALPDGEYLAATGEAFDTPLAVWSPAWRAIIMGRRSDRAAPMIEAFPLVESEAWAGWTRTSATDAAKRGAK